MKTQNISVLSFDCFGTLIDWEAGVISALRPILMHHRSNPLSDSNIIDSFHTARRRVPPMDGYISYREILERVTRNLADSWSIRMEDADVHALALSIKEWKPFPEVPTVLQRLKQNYKLAIISNTDNNLIATSIPKLKIDFDWIITSEDAKCYKPSLEIFKHALDKIKISPPRIMHVGCSLFHDVAPAKFLGLTTVWVNRGKASDITDRPPAENADFEIADLSTLVEILQDA